MKSLLFVVLIVLALGIVPAAAVTIDVTPTLAPNGWGSPSFAAWQANAIYALAHGLSSYGTPGSPSYYQAGDEYNSAQVIVTDFPSWMGMADPGAAYGSAYSSELGNRMTFGLVIDGQGTQFSISQLALSASSTDPYDGLFIDFPPGGYDYGLGYVGVLPGPDGILGTSDDLYITSGPNTQMVDELIGRGTGNSFEADCSGCTTAQQQAAILGVASYPGTAFSFTETYSLIAADGDTLASGSGTIQIDPIPEPASMGLLGFGLAALCVIARKRRLRAPARP